jgi:60 kDa SS-A/Ro ribonucleoprotein
MKNYNKPIPNSLKKGLRKAIGKFNSYELGKYKGEKKEVSMVDLINLIHPKPTDKNGFAIGDLVNGTLKANDTWEKNLTQAGQKAKTEEEKSEFKKEVWVNLIKERKIGYFALLRNLRNIIEQAPDILDEAIVMLTDEKLIKNSLVLPFRYATAYRQIQNDLPNCPRKVIAGISKAGDIALSNVPKFDGKTCIVLDVSGSMNGKPIEIGSMFAAVLAKTNDDADFVIFANEAKYKALNPQDSALTLADNIMRDDEVGGGTNFHSIFETINKKYDRIIILSDMQGWMEDSSFMHPGAPSETFKRYKNKYSADPFVYSFNLNDYGTLMFPEKKVCAIAGWSEKIFDLMKILETDKDALINEIEKIQL